MHESHITYFVWKLQELNIGEECMSEPGDKESFLPGVGIVMSNAQIESVDPSDIIITEDNLTVKPTELRVRQK